MSNQIEVKEQVRWEDLEVAEEQEENWKEGYECACPTCASGIITEWKDERILDDRITDEERAELAAAVERFRQYVGQCTPSRNPLTGQGND